MLPESFAEQPVAQNVLHSPAHLEIFSLKNNPYAPIGSFNNYLRASKNECPYLSSCSDVMWLNKCRYVLVYCPFNHVVDMTIVMLHYAWCNLLLLGSNKWSCHTWDLYLCHK